MTNEIRNELKSALAVFSEAERNAQGQLWKCQDLAREVNNTLELYLRQIAAWNLNKNASIQREIQVVCLRELIEKAREFLT